MLITLNDFISLAENLNKWGQCPEFTREKLVKMYDEFLEQVDDCDRLFDAESFDAKWSIVLELAEDVILNAEYAPA